MNHSGSFLHWTSKLYLAVVLRLPTVFYRDNWYLDAWCHLRAALRSFALDALRSVRTLDQDAAEVPACELDAVLGAGYGIFGGRPDKQARLRFSPVRARWVVDERWHPEQKSWREDDGSLVLEIPYADDRELLLDILRHGSEVEVLAPAELREFVSRELLKAFRRYQGLGLVRRGDGRKESA